MSRRDVRSFLEDVLIASDAIANMVAGVTFQQYTRNLEKRSAVERQLTIIGEAVSQVDKVRPDWTARVTGVPAIIGFRNILVHRYEIVSDEIVWDLIQIHLPKLRDEVAAILVDVE